MKQWLVAAGLAVVMSGCAGPQRGVELIPLERFRQSDSHPNQLIYTHPGTTLAGYQQVLLMPLQFLRQEQDQWYLLTTAQETEIGSYYHQRMEAALAAEGITLTDKAGAGVLVIQAAVTNLQLKQPDLTVVDLLPAKIAINAAKQAVGMEPWYLNVGSVTQLRDGVSDQLLVRVLNMRQSKDAIPGGDKITWPEAQKMIEDWTRISARQLAAELKRR